MGRRVLLCVYWGDQVVPSIRCNCVDCGRPLAMDKLSEPKQKELKLKPICVSCLEKVSDRDGVDFSGAIMDGKVRPFDWKI